MVFFKICRELLKGFDLEWRTFGRIDFIEIQIKISAIGGLSIAIFIVFLVHFWISLVYVKYLL